MATLYWTFPTTSDFSDRNNWRDEQNNAPSAPPGGGDTIVVDIGGTGSLAAGGAGVANAYLSGERITGGLAVSSIVTGFGTLASGTYALGTIRRLAFQEAPWAGGTTVDLLGLTIDAASVSASVDIALGGSVLAQNGSTFNASSLTLGTDSAGGASGTFSTQSGSHATIAGTAIVNKGTLNVGHITLGAGTIVDLNGGLQLNGYGSMQVFAGAAGNVTGSVSVDTVAVNLPGGIAGGVVVRGTDGALTINGDVTIAATLHGLVRVMQGGSATINGKLVLGRDNGASATLDLSGTGTTFKVTDTVDVGRAGAATISTLSGETATFEKGLTLGAAAGGSGSVSMFGGTLSWSGDFAVGKVGSGTVLVQSGAKASGYDFSAHAGTGDMQISPQGQGTVTVSGSGSVLEARDLTIGNADATVDDCDDWTYAGTSGKLTLSDGGFVAVARKLVLDNADPAGGSAEPVISLTANARMEVGGNSSSVAGHLVIDATGAIEGHGIIAAPIIDNNGSIRVHEGVLQAIGQVTGNGTITIEGQTEFHVRDDLDNNIVFEGAEGSILRLDDWRSIPGVNPGFEGTISGLEDGDTIAIKQFPGMPEAAHTVIDGSGDLLVTFQDGTTVRFDLSGDVSGHVFTIRYLPGDYIGLTYRAANADVLTGAQGGSSLGGQPTGTPYLDSLINGFAKWNKNIITYHLGTNADIHDAIEVHGESVIIECDDTVGAFNAAHRAAIERAFAAISAVTPLTFVETSSVEDANITFWMVDQIPGNPSGYTEQLTDMPDGHVFVHYDQSQITTATTGVGGFGAAMVTHEIVHALGLVHPHDGGAEPDGTTFPGVPRGDIDNLGTNQQNQEVYTVMSYNEGLAGAGAHDTSFGTQYGLGALDIAALQLLYGTTGSHNPTDAYDLPMVNGVGTGWKAIWDTGGIDVISAAGAIAAATIDLRPAPLVGPNAGGFASHIAGIAGGLTIAAGVAIENAVGGGGDDTLTGNALDNILQGGDGDDTIDGGGGFDTAAYGGAQAFYEVTRTAIGAVVSGTDGEDTLTNVERVSFADGFLDIDSLPVSDQPIIISDGGGASALMSRPENGTVVTTVTAHSGNGAALSFSIVGGDDQAMFTIGATSGVLSFVTPPDFEAPTDADHDNRYLVRVQVSNSISTDQQFITVEVTDVDESASPPSGTPGDDTFHAGAGSETFGGGLGLDTIVFDFALVDATVTYQGNKVIIDGPASHTVLSGFEDFQFTDGAVRNLDGNSLIDDLFYFSRNHDVWNAGIDADAHYDQFGWREGRDPNAFFSSAQYLAINPDVRAAGIDPLGHFHHNGWHEGRVPSFAFDLAKYLEANPDVAAAGVDPLDHFLRHGEEEGRVPFAVDKLIGPTGFDAVYYLQSNPDVAAAGVDPFWHFQIQGWREGRNPNALFDTAGYLATYTDVAAAGVNPLDHYHTHGWREGRDPGVAFDTTDYLANYVDVANAQVDPLAHFLRFGQAEGRSGFADGVWG